MPKEVAEPTLSKSVTLSFSTEAELKVYAAYAEAAKEEDRSISTFIVRYLLGKEEAPQVGGN